MSKVELGSLIHTALRHSLGQQEKIVAHAGAVNFLTVIQRLAKFNAELECWYSGRYHLPENDRGDYFLAQAEGIEAVADRISEETWEYAPVSLIPIFRRIRDRRLQIQEEESYPRQLRAQFNNFRLGLLEQVVGARFLENNNDLGEETERILVQYLSRRFGNSVRILRGGHIYDYDNNRSNQIDILITPANALGFCPADTGDGKHNVMIDQVIAAISVTSRLTPSGFRKRMEELQKIPLFKEKNKSYPGLKASPWPICYIVGAECEDLGALKKMWDETGSPDKPPAMVIVLDSGYIMQRTLYPAAQGPDIPKRIDQLFSAEGIYAGLGLGWLELQITARNSWLTNQRADWINRLQIQLRELERTEGHLTHDEKREPMFWGLHPIQGVLRWGASGIWAHNRLFLTSLFVRDCEYVVDATLIDPSKPAPKGGLLDFKFEPRWFKHGLYATNGDFCALKEWTDPRDREKHRRRITVFDARTAEDVTSRLTAPLLNCSDLEHLHPVLREN